MDCREFNQNLWTTQANIYCICFSRLEWVALTLMSLILYFKFPQPINSGCSQSASMDVSRWAFDVFLEQFGAREADAIANFYRRISTVPAAGSLRGHLFEKQTLNHLCGIHDASEFWIRRLTDSNRRAWTCRGPVERLDTLESEFPEAITKAVGKPKPLHLIPLARNFRAVDSILYDPNDLLVLKSR